jgi:hypothetical protein
MDIKIINSCYKSAQYVKKTKLFLNLKRKPRQLIFERFEHKIEQFVISEIFH